MRDKALFWKTFSVLLVVVVALLLILHETGTGNTKPKSPTHHATCWAKPGFIVYVGPHRVVARYSKYGIRHGRGGLHSDVCDVG